MILMPLRAVFFLIFIVLIPLRGSAQIHEYEGKFGTFRAFVDVPSYQVDIKSKVSNQGHHVLWKPNLRALTGVDFFINGFIGAGISWANLDETGSATKRGVTEFTDYRVGLTMKSFRGEAHYQRYRGFYVDNSAEIDPAYAGTENKILDPSMLGGNISVNGTFVSKPEKFSYTAAIGQDERQESTGGSWLWGFAASETFFRTDGTSLIPAAVRSSFGEDRNVFDMHFYSLTVKGGYGHTFVAAKKWFATGILMIGAGGEYREYRDNLRKTTAGGSAGKADIVISFGYNGDDFLAAIIGTADITAYNTQSLEIPAQIGDAKIAIGAHF
jgi:hypothetical protein